MPRVPRTELPDGFFHVTCRGTGGGAIFLDDLDRIAFVRLLVATIRRSPWICDTYCLMTNHYHLLLDTTCERLSSGMQLLNGGYSRRFNARHDRFGHLFHGRFGARVIDGDDYLETVREYVLANPVRAGLCSAVAEWPWAGYGAPGAGPVGC